MALWIESFGPHGITQFSLYEGASNKIIIWVDLTIKVNQGNSMMKNTKENFKVYYFKVPWFDEERFTVPLSSISFFVSDFYWSEQFWCKLHQCPWRAVECVTVFVDFNWMQTHISNTAGRIPKILCGIFVTPSRKSCNAWWVRVEPALSWPQLLSNILHASCAMLT